MAEEDLLEKTCRQETVGVGDLTCHLSARENLSTAKIAVTDDDGCLRLDAPVSIESNQSGWVGEGLQTPSVVSFGK